MAEEAAALFVRLEARTRELEKGLARAEQKTATATKNMRRSVRGTGFAFDQLSQKVKLLGTTFLTTKVIAYADSYKKLQNSIRAVSDEGSDLNKITTDLFGVAQRSRSSLGATANLYRDVTIATQDLNLSSERTIRLIETMQKAAPGATDALRQLGQGLAAGAVRGQEYNSVVEQAPLIARAIADEFGVSIAALRGLANEGAITTDRVIAGLEKYAATADELIHKQSVTVQQSLVMLDNAFTMFIGGQDSALGATDALAAGLMLLAENLDTVADAFAVIATVLVGRYAGQAAAAALTKTAALQASVAGLGVRAGASAVAMRGLSASMAFFGGPVGFAITAIVGSMALLAGQTRRAQAEFERLVSPVGDVEGAIYALEDAAKAYSDAIAGNASTQLDATKSIVASTKKEFNAKKALLELEIERREAANRERTARIAELHEVASKNLGNYPAPEDQTKEWQKIEATRMLDNATGALKEAKELIARRDLADISIARGREVLNTPFEDLAAESRVKRGAASTPKATPKTVKGDKSAATAAKKLEDERAKAAAELADARVEEARATEDLARTVEALGGWESKRAKTARDRMETAERAAAVERARADVLRDGGSQELADLAARTLDAEQKREVLLDTLTEKERYFSDLKDAELEAEKQRIQEAEEASEKAADLKEARLKRLNKFMEDAHEKRLAEQKENAAKFGEALIDQMDAALEYSDALEAAEKRRAENVRETNKTILDGFTNAVAGAESFEDALEKVGIQLLKIAASGFFDGLSGGTGDSGGLLGSIFGALGTAAFSALPSFDGGGGTGNGARVGGLDGKGGFPAILHPREVVNDLTKGGGRSAGGGGVSVSHGDIIVKGGADKTALREMQRMQRMQTAATIAELQKLQTQGLA